MNPQTPENNNAESSTECHSEAREFVKVLEEIGRNIMKLEEDISLFRSGSKAILGGLRVGGAVGAVSIPTHAETELSLSRTLQKLQGIVAESGLLRQEFYKKYHGGNMLRSDIHAIERGYQANVYAMRCIGKTVLRGDPLAAEPRR